MWIVLVGCTGEIVRSESNLPEVNHIVHMGQSLGAGEQSLPIVTTEETGFGNLKFSMGTHTWTQSFFADTPGRRAENLFTFVGLTAQQRGAEGETIANGMCDHLSDLIQNSKDHKFLFSYAGQGGRYLRELNKRHDDAKNPKAGTRQSPGGYYQTSIDDVRRAKYLCDSIGVSYSVFGITWMQGEGNGTAKVNRWSDPLSIDDAIETYKLDLIDLKNDYQQDLARITGQRPSIPFFSYQTAGNLAAMAQLQACDQEDDMFLVAPTYMLPNAENGKYLRGDKLVHGDGIHLTADGERWLGEQFGKVMHRVIIEGKAWQPMSPLEAWFEQGSETIHVTLHVPVPPMVIDTSFLPAQGRGLGFEIFDAENRVFQIASILMDGEETLIIELQDSLPLNKDVFIRYGLNSFVANVSKPVEQVRTVSFASDDDYTEIEFPGDIRSEFRKLVEEGVFYLNSKGTDGDRQTNLIVREVLLNSDGNTVLRGEVDDLLDGVSFQTGQRCFTSRRYSFGNIRDSDDELSTFGFADGSYGTRKGMRYPLHNWCVGFDEFEVKIRSKR